MYKYILVLGFRSSSHSNTSWLQSILSMSKHCFSRFKIRSVGGSKQVIQKIRTPAFIYLRPHYGSGRSPEFKIKFHK